jgi:Glycosyl transferase family 2
MPKISILAPAYNHAKYIRFAVEGVLAQTFSDFEYIISDDASSDDTLLELERFSDSRIKVLANDKNCGVSINYKRCLAEASGEYIICLPTDDILEPNALAVLSAALDSSSACLSVFARALFVNEGGSLTGEEFTDAGVGLNRFQLLKTVFEQNHVLCASAQLTRRESLESSGFFKDHLLQTQDIYFWAKLLFMGDCMVLPDLLVRYRQRDNNLNLSGANPQADHRFSFETNEVLELYLSQIKTFALLSKIFPEALEKDWPDDDRFVPFYLAQLAMEVAEFPYYRLFALRVLNNLLASKEMAGALQESLNFGYKDLFALTGNTKIFFEPHLAAKKERLQNVVNQQTEQVKKMYEQIDDINRRRSQLEMKILEQNSQIGDLVDQNTTLSHYCNTLESSCRQYAQSLSWKVTAPLRQVKSALVPRVE